MARNPVPILKSILSLLILILILNPFISADPRVNSVTMNPPSPLFGDAVDITVDYCAQLNNAAEIAIAISSQAVKDNADLSGTGQVFVVSRAGIDVATSQPALSPGGIIHWEANPNPGGGTADCDTCSGTNDGRHFIRTYTVHVPPASYFPGCSINTLYLHVGMKDSNLNTGDWAGRPACSSGPVLSWAMPLLPKGFTMGKRVEGVLQITNDLVLYSVDYEYWNGQLVITDSIPGGGNLTLVSFGPTAITGGTVTGPAIGATSGNFTWTLPNRGGMNGKATGTVWMLYRMNNNVAAGTRFSNTAQGTMSGVTTQNASASIIVGQAAVTITKDQSDTAPNWGDQITYFLTYQVNGSKLIAYQPFDDIALGTYGDPAGLGGSPPAGWSFNQQGGVNGQWTISDPCNTGDRQIMGDATAGDKYPSLLYDGLPATNHMCKGIIMTDVLLVPGGYEGADAMVVIRSDGVVGAGKAYGLVLSVDDNIGTNGTGNIGFQRCDGATCIWPSSVNTLAITSNKWWRVKIEVAPPPGNNQYEFRAKVWAKGDPEPGGWTITWTDPTPPAAFDCNSGATWKPGIAEQHGASGDVHDTYNNFIIYEPRVSADTYVWDTPPTGVTYVGQQGPHPLASSPNPIKWNLGTISDEGGTFTWWGTVNTCNPISNDGWINGAPPLVANKSNVVTAVPLCPEMTGITKTANVTQANVGDTITWTITYCNDGHGPIVNYTMTDPIPPGMNCLGCTTPSGTCSCGPPVTFNIGTVPPGTCNVAVRWWGRVTAP